MKGGKRGGIDSSGKIVIPIEYDEILLPSALNEGIKFVKNEEGKAEPYELTASMKELEYTTYKVKC
jgi:hypothetical protein